MPASQSPTPQTQPDTDDVTTSRHGTCSHCARVALYPTPPTRRSPFRSRCRTNRHEYELGNSPSLRHNDYEMPKREGKRSPEPDVANLHVEVRENGRQLATWQLKPETTSRGHLRYYTMALRTLFKIALALIRGGIWYSRWLGFLFLFLLYTNVNNNGKVREKIKLRFLLSENKI